MFSRCLRRLCAVPLDPSYTAMNFLQTPKTLCKGARAAKEVCTQLYQLLEKPLTPQHRHDVLDSMSNTLCLVLDPCEFVRHMHPGKAYKEGAQEAFSEAHTFMCELNTSAFLYEQLLIVTKPEAFATLDSESKKNIVQLKRDMESNGIHLPESQRKEVMELNCEREEIAALFLQKEGQQNPIGTLRKLLLCRRALAKRLEFDSFAAQQLRGTILDSQEKVWHFLCAVSHKYWPQALKEIEFLRTLQGNAKRTQEFTDDARAMTSHSYRRREDALHLEEYFSVANCWKGIEILCAEVFGLTLRELPMPVHERYHPEVQKFAVIHDTEGFMGTIVVDLFSRPDKGCQAGHMTVQLGCRPHAGVMEQIGVKVPPRQFPIVVLTCNAGSVSLPQRNPDGTCNRETTRMHAHEVTTLFHEFGHAVHSIFGQTTVQNLAGTRSSIDFVETFSQLFELFISSPQFVQRFAKNMQGEPIPREKVEKYAEIRNQLRACDIMDQVVMSGIDQAVHGPQPIATYFPKPGSRKGELAKLVIGHFDDFGEGILDMAKLMVQIGKPLSPIVPTEKGVLRSLSTEHMASYPATYYGYLYSAVFARRIWDKFFSRNPLSREEGDRLRKEVLSYGAACDPRQTLQEYLKEDLDNLEVWV